MAFLKSHDQIMRELEAENVELCALNKASAAQYYAVLICSDCSPESIARAKHEFLKSQERYEFACSATARRKDAEKADRDRRRSQYGPIMFRATELIKWFTDKFWSIINYRRKSGWATIEEESGDFIDTDSSNGKDIKKALSD